MNAVNSFLIYQLSEPGFYLYLTDSSEKEFGEIIISWISKIRLRSWFKQLHIDEIKVKLKQDEGSKFIIQLPI
jgi:hypothetical protein